MLDLSFVFAETQRVISEPQPRVLDVPVQSAISGLLNSIAEISQVLIQQPINLVALLLFAVGGFLIVYHHFLYPVLISFLVRRKQTKRMPPAPVLYPNSQPSEHNAFQGKESQQSASGAPYCDLNSPDEINWPSVAIVIPVYNEGKLVADKIRNLAFLDYPQDKVSIYLLFDGCTDRSVQYAQQALQDSMCQSLNCHLMIDPINRGKLAQINRAIEKCSQELVALTDTSALIAADSLKIAALWFQQRKIGAVCGTYRFLSQAAVQEQSYWQYQCSIKQAESTLGSTLGAHGAFYMIRRALFKPLASDCINDDFILPCEIIRQGSRVIYEPRMVAVELENSSLNQDFKRRIRISAGNMQQSLRLTDLLHPSYGITGWMFFSCKWLRPFIPWCFVICLITSIWLSSQLNAFIPLLMVQLLVYGLVILQQLRPLKNSLMIKLHYLISGHFIGLLGGFYYLRGDFKHSWQKVR